MGLITLRNAQSPLADTATQRAVLDALPLARSFGHALSEAGHAPLRASAVDVLQINLGKRCNQACRHCHVDAGPDRTEVMPDRVVEACLDALEARHIPTLDITGGAPELHPRFREIVRRARAAGRHVIDRCNLTITQLPNYADLPEFLAAERVEVVASLPSFAGRQTDAQRGDGVFARSIAALRRLNALGYGASGNGSGSDIAAGLVLNLVTNPVGAFLPANQAALEADWRRELQRQHGVVFNRLYTITNMPISRYLQFLLDSGNFESYMEKLVAAFNPAAVAGLMCRSTLSVGWDGRLYDCDFNQMLDLGLDPSAPQTIFEAASTAVAFEVAGDLAGAVAAEVQGERVPRTGDPLASRRIAIGPHCFGCTAGAGSSCGGTIVA
jgi:radical SAM/Cys-rich protein